MKLIITLCLATLFVFLNVETKAQQQLTLTEAARAAAAGPEFCPRSPCPGFENIRSGRSVSSTPPKPSVQAAKVSGPLPPQPYQPSRDELNSRAVRTGQPQAADVTEGDQAAYPGHFDAHGHSLAARQPDLGEYSPQLEARSRKIFTTSMQEAKRQQWMADQEQRAIANDINRSKPLMYPVIGR
jgi:hypothetical protein